jgi:YtcA family
MLVREFRKAWLPCLALMGFTGCSGGPSIEFIGTFFPVWMFCIIAALAITGLMRVGLVRWGLEQKLGPLVVFYPSLTVAFSCLLWLIFFS